MRRGCRGGEFGEAAFDEVDPARAGRGEVQVEAWVSGEPVLDLGGLVGCVVVEDQVHVELGGDFAVDLLEELLNSIAR
jgi:hypothetical protein